MKLLVLGGTKFLGRHIVEQALAAEHDVTLFNRGQTNPELFEGEVRKVIGDRMTDLGLLGDESFDACIDPSGYIPGHLEAAGEALKDKVNRYVFISSLSAYAGFPDDQDESGVEAEIPEDVDTSLYDIKYYGELKVLCERAIEAVMPGRVLHVRSGLIVGPYDPTNRFTYWPARISRGGSFVAPVGPDFPVQIVHAADQARWILKMLEDDKMGVYNVQSDNGAYTISDVIDATLKATGVDAEPVYMSSAFLTEHEVGPWMELPLWLPDDMVGMSRTSAKKAINAGLTFMPLEDVVRSTLDWFNSEPEQDWPAGLPAEKEAALLDAWSSR